MNKKKITQQTTTIHLNEETGQVISSDSTKTYMVDKEPDYIKMYISDIARLKEIPAGMDKILFSLLKGMGYNNIVPVYMPIKQMIANDLGVSINYINKAIDKFYKAGLLIRHARGLYIADPQLFARGKWEDIKDLRLVIDYKSDGTKKLQSNLPEKVQLQLGF